MTKGIAVSVLRNANYKGQAHQETNLFDSFTLTGSGLPEVFEPISDHPELVLLPGNVPGSWKAVPETYVEENEDGTFSLKVWTMFGGHYVTTSNAQLGDIVGRPTVVPVHDRIEGKRPGTA